MKKNYLFLFFILTFSLVGCNIFSHTTIPNESIICSQIDSITYENRVYNKILNEDLECKITRNEIIGYIVKDESMIKDDGLTYIVNEDLYISIFGEEITNPQYTMYSIKDSDSYIYLDYNANGLYNLFKLEDKYLVKDINDIYALNDNKMNFLTLYVVENNNGIIKFISDIHSNKSSYIITELYLSDGTTKMTNKDYNIISFNGLYDVNDLKYGDELICYFDYQKSHIYKIYPELNVFDLFFIKENLNVEFEYYVIP